GAVPRTVTDEATNSSEIVASSFFVPVFLGRPRSRLLARPTPRYRHARGHPGASIAVRGGELRPGDIQREGQIGILYPRAAEVRPEQIHPREVASSEIGTDEQRVPQVGAAQPVAAQIGAGEVGSRDQIGM